MTNQFTPGPWSVSLVKPDLAKGHTFEPVCSVTGKFDGKTVRLADIPDCVDNESEANARLIAAAPELLAALKAAVSYLEDDSRSERRRAACLDSFRAAIAKAEG